MELRASLGTRKSAKDEPVWRQVAASEARTCQVLAPCSVMLPQESLRLMAVGRRNWTFAGSDRGGERAAAVYTLIETCKLNGVNPQAWLADVLARLPDYSAKHIGDLLPWNWCAARPDVATASHLS